jgi:hypothetical protein
LAIPEKGRKKENNLQTKVKALASAWAIESISCLILLSGSVLLLRRRTRGGNNQLPFNRLPLEKRGKEMIRRQKKSEK